MPLAMPGAGSMTWPRIAAFMSCIPRRGASRTNSLNYPPRLHNSNQPAGLAGTLPPAGQQGANAMRDFESIIYKICPNIYQSGFAYPRSALAELGVRVVVDLSGGPSLQPQDFG